MRARTAAVLVGTLVAAAGVFAAGPVQAVQASVAATTSSMWQTNGTVRAVLPVNGVVYVAGEFTAVRPPDAAPGVNERPASYLAAFSTETGEPISTFSHTLDAPVWSLAASSDGSRLFVGGDFSTVDGAGRSRLAAFATATGALDTTWRPTATGRVKALAVSGSTVYLGGSFGTVSGATRSRLAAVSTATTGALLPWAPAADRDVYALEMAPDGGHVYAGGDFNTINGEARRALAKISASTGDAPVFAAASAIPPISTSCTSRVKALEVTADRLFVAAGGDGGGCFDGTFAAAHTGELLWRSNCLGATEAIAVVGGWLYKGSHAHDCSPAGGFPETSGSRAYTLLVQDPATGALGPWFPSTNTGGTTLVGPLAMGTDGAQLFVGGDFTTVNGRTQQGITRFRATPNTQPGRPQLTVSSTESGVVKVNVKAAVDLDDSALTYRLYRDNQQPPIATWTGLQSAPWLLPTRTYRDTGLVPGSSHTYQLDVTDGSLRRLIGSASLTVASTRAPYAGQVRSEPPFLHWRLGEASGATTAADASGNGRTGTYSGVTLGTAGASSDGDRAVTLGSASRINTTSTSVMLQPQQFSVETWVRTTTTSGGRIVGFGNSRTGTSSTTDRVLYMTNAGKLAFGVHYQGREAIISPTSYNDGAWHHVVATLGDEGMALHVDGVTVATNPATRYGRGYDGWWRVGNDTLANWPSRPTADGFSGAVDEIAVYQHVLPLSSVQDHFLAR